MSNITPIEIPFPEAEELHLRLMVGACRLRIKPGDGPQWVTGTYEDPSNAVPLRIVEEGGTVRISQAFSWPESWGTVSQPTTFDLALGRGRPFVLTLEGGASEGDIDLGGLSITRLTVKYGAGKQEIRFSSPNPQPMDELTISTGAAGLEMTGLANANFARMFVEGGAAGCEFDFGGALRRDASVKITTAMASVEIDVPAAMAVKVNADAVLGNVMVPDGFLKKEGAFWSEAASAGATPLLDISASVVMGSIRIEAS
jgi:hypothetical protein